MRVLMLTDVFQPCPQSASQRVSSFAQVLSSKGYEVVVVTSSRCKRSIRKFAEDQGIMVYDLKCPRFLMSISNLMINPILFLLYFFMSAAVAVGRKIDVVFATVPNGETAIAGFFLSEVLQNHLIVDMRDLYPPPPVELPFLNLHAPETLNDLLIHFFSFLYRNSSRLACVDGNIKQKLMALGLESKRIELIPNGADASLYIPHTGRERDEIRIKYGFTCEDFIFVYAGALISYYPMHHAISGFSHVVPKDGNLKLLIISPMSYSAQEKLAKELGLKECVQFKGPFSAAMTAEILSACDVGIVVYPRENYFKSMYGSKIFSYMACGLPILASGPPKSVLDTLINKFKVGFFIGEPNEGNFENGFSYFLNNKGKGKQMGARARKAIEDFYDRRKLGLKLAALIAGLSKANDER